MRLKQLELQGYKTFASTTEFLIQEGITAIVGPNGSGKSNIADAIRWVLGEQSYSTLRARRTEDMIFSGSERRARQGMARVTLTLDNTTGWLPIEFSQVAIERRAYRSGENEYYLNGNRVRLRDITELLGQSGLGRRTYTVIGQGLVDRALSLGPAERRALFEEAAGITIYQDKRGDALRKLEQTQQNIVRVNDIINEIAPRLRHLAREAQRAQEQITIAARLQKLLRIWYGYRWREGSQALRLARAVAQHRRKSLQKVQNEISAATREIGDLRGQQETLRASLIRWHRESSALHDQAQSLQRDIAVSQERARLLHAQRQELLAGLDAPQTNRRQQAARVADAQAELARLQSQLAERRTALDAARQRLDALQAERRDLLAALTAAQDRAFALATDLADRANRRTQIQERQTALTAERAAHGEKIGRLQADLAAAEAAQVELQAQIAGLQAETEALQGCRADQQTHLTQLDARRGDLQAQLADAGQQQARLQDRYDLLDRMRQEGQGLYAGVRAVLQAARPADGPTLQGIVGVLANLIDVPAGLERAIEAGLGARLQNIVVQTWDDAVAAIEHLKKAQSGRATFLPLDTLRPRPPLNLTALQNMPGVVGLASQLVASDAALRPAVELSLGQTLVVENMTIARRAYDQLSGGFQIVTRDGELLRSDGALTGGRQRAAQDDGLLAREREWRDLPAQLAALAKGRAALTRDLAALEDEMRGLENEIAGLQTQAGQHAARRTALGDALAGRDKEADRLAQEIEWLQGLVRQTSDEAETLRARTERLHAEQQNIAQQQAQVQQGIAACQTELEARAADALLADVNARQTDLAVVEQSLAGQQAILQSHQATLAQLDAQLQASQARIAALESQTQEVEEQLGALSAQHRAVSEKLSGVQAHITPAEQQLEELEARRNALDAQADELRQRRGQYETRHNQAVLQVTRHEDEMAALKRQIEDELGLVEVEMDEGLRGQPPLPLRPLVSTLPSVEQLPEGMEEEMRHLRAQMRRLGAVNPNAPQEYDEQLERHTFLLSQAQDLQQAAAQLRQVIAELDALMEKAFRETFDAVAKAFSGYFKRLFGGGSARLLLAEPDNVMQSGVEIVARPPGKRTQSLALLSGGERALAATALIFAILQVNPPPFSILDEVDAMLDEANVGRFVELLREQAQHNQFIVITHNRATMRAANVLYGVTMGDDSVSRVYSRKLDDAE